MTDSFGQYARRCRKQARVSLYLLGKATGLAPVELQAIERNEAPPPQASTLVLWATALRVPVEDFVGRAGRDLPTAADDA